MGVFDRRDSDRTESPPLLFSPLRDCVAIHKMPHSFVSCHFERSEKS